MRKRYENMDQVNNTTSMKDMIQWRKERKAKVKDLSFVIPRCERVELDLLHSNQAETTITWIGHSTFFIQIGGLNIVTDPVWANRMGFERRLAPPGIPLKDLPPVDVVLISHSHYDHLDYPTLRKLNGNPRYLVPEGLKRSFRKKGFEPTEEYGWWDSTAVGGVEFYFVPAQHWTKRTLTDTNRSWWGGWIIRHHGECIYFAGDSGYFRGFKEIGSRFDIDIALIPIGAYEPEWFMKMQHVSPEEAVQAYIDTGARMFIPMHYGAFRLADDTPKEALDRLKAAWKQENLEPKELKILEHGETLCTQNGKTIAEN
ncbi:MBL fold metallo-hydrolase [Marinicrinis lubricantis]|uniref:MBL fold metallo-hydrolase n=1 Tax=Marinicrinis lubricantis TaxID=2086470 RepID=A0ABW1IL42_9BACL